MRIHSLAAELRNAQFGAFERFAARIVHATHFTTDSVVVVPRFEKRWFLMVNG